MMLMESGSKNTCVLQRGRKSSPVDFFFFALGENLDKIFIACVCDVYISVRKRRRRFSKAISNKGKIKEDVSVQQLFKLLRKQQEDLNESRGKNWFSFHTKIGHYVGNIVWVATLSSTPQTGSSLTWWPFRDPQKSAWAAPDIFFFLIMVHKNSPNLICKLWVMRIKWKWCLNRDRKLYKAALWKVRHIKLVG